MGAETFSVGVVNQKVKTGHVAGRKTTKDRWRE